MIALQHVSKRFADQEALRDVSFDIGENQVCGFVGPNGAGKTTTLRIISGFLSPDTGTVIIDGVDVARDPRSTCARIGYLPENAPVYPEMRVRDYLRFRAQVKDLGRDRIAAFIDQSIEQAGLKEHDRQVIGRLSRGFRQRVGVADALLGDPRILLLDEPTSGLDPVQVREFREIVKALSGQHTVVFCSHILPEVESLADTMVILSGGSVVGEGSLAALRNQHKLPETASLEEVFIAAAQIQGHT